jgi:hypothetical protein
MFGMSPPLITIDSSYPIRYCQTRVVIHFLGSAAECDFIVTIGTYGKFHNVPTLVSGTARPVLQTGYLRCAPFVAAEHYHTSDEDFGREPRETDYTF